MGRTSYRAARAAILPRLVELTRFAPRPVLMGIRPAVSALLHASSLRERVDRNMAAALGRGGYEPAHVRAYFSHLADLLTFSVASYHSGVHRAGVARQWVPDPGGLETFRAVLAAGKGAVMCSPHLIGHEMLAGSVTAHYPVAFIARKSPDPRYEALKKRWYAALGVEVIHAPHGEEGVRNVSQLAGILRVLRSNRVLGLTPDLIQRPGTGIPVTLFGRTVELPAGTFFFPVRTGAPLMPTFFHQEGKRYRAWTTGPLEPARTLERDAAIADLAQRWTAHFEQFLREHPDMWQFWLDKRWSRWLAA